MTVFGKDHLKRWLADPALAGAADLRAQIRQSPSTPDFLAAIRQEIPLGSITPLTYTLYREFEHTGSRPGYQNPYYLRRAQLTRAVLEVLLGDTSMIDHVHDLAWAICEETSWLVPAHEEQGPGYWDLEPPRKRATPLGAHTMLTREPDSIDLFAAETGAALAEAVYLVGDMMAPEVRERIRQEVARHIFKPYLARARDHWWYKGALNWNGVCNGSVGLAFLRLENDLETLAEALALVLEGFAAYIATGFEADGGSIEGVGYWNYGLMYYVIVAELLRERTGGALDLLAQPRLRDIAAYPPGMTLVAPGRFINFGDALEEQPIAAGIGNRLAERTGVDQLRSLFIPVDAEHPFSAHGFAKLPVVLRHVAWWDQTQPTPAHIQQDYTLPESGVLKLVGQTQDGETAILATKGGHNDGHHSHTDIATFIVNIGGESLIPDAGRGLYSKAYFREARYENVFNNSYTHNVPRIDGQLQAPGPEFGGSQQFYGEISEHGAVGDQKYAVIAFHTAYDLPALTLAQRHLGLDTASGVVTLDDEFDFIAEPLPIEEAFVTWFPVAVDGAQARILGERTALELVVLEPAGVSFTVEALADDCRANNMDQVLNRLAVTLPAGATRFRLRMTPQHRG